MGWRSPERTPGLGQRTELVLPARAGELLRLRLLVSVVEAFLEFEGSLRMELDLQANGIAPVSRPISLTFTPLNAALDFTKLLWTRVCVSPAASSMPRMPAYPSTNVSGAARRHSAECRPPRGGGLRRLACLAHHPAQLVEQRRLRFQAMRLAA